MDKLLIVSIGLAVIMVVLKIIELVLPKQQISAYDNEIEYTCSRCNNYYKTSSDEVILFSVCPNCAHVEEAVSLWEQ